MTNPNDAVGTNAAYGGRTSPNAFNDNLASYSRGVLSGWACSPSSGLTVSLGGNGSTRDVAIAEDNTGNKTTINNISGSPISVTISAAPSTNSRIDLIVAYVDNPPTGTSTVTDNPATCGLIVVKGTAAATPVAPNESAIRTAITGDGASGTTAYYVVLAQITIASGTTTLTTNNIVAGSISKTTVESSIQDYLDLNNFTSPTITVNGGTLSDTRTILRCASNADGSLGKVYGRIYVTSTATTTTISFPTPLRPSSAFVVDGIAFGQWNDSDGSDGWSAIIMHSISIAENGTATITVIDTLNGRRRNILLNASLIFAKSFGDTLIV